MLEAALVQLIMVLDLMVSVIQKMPAAIPAVLLPHVLIVSLVKMLVMHL